MRNLARKNAELRKVEFIPSVSKYADGSCLVSFGSTKVMCTATIENRVPLFLKKSGTGWITAEYGMLPASCNGRMEREAIRGGQTGRSQEIQRLIGRSFRSVTNLSLMGEKQIIVDCDVIQGDGGTRTAAITGGYIALYQAVKKLEFREKITGILKDQVAAISCGIVDGAVLLDLDFEEDSNAEVDCNFVMTSTGKIIEIQGTAEKNPFSESQFTELLNLAKAGIVILIDKQKQIIKEL